MTVGIDSPIIEPRRTAVTDSRPVDGPNDGVTKRTQRTQTDGQAKPRPGRPSDMNDPLTRQWQAQNDPMTQTANDQLMTARPDGQYWRTDDEGVDNDWTNDPDPGPTQPRPASDPIERPDGLMTDDPVDPGQTDRQTNDDPARWPGPRTDNWQLDGPLTQPSPDGAGPRPGPVSDGPDGRRPRRRPDPAQPSW